MQITSHPPSRRLRGCLYMLAAMFFFALMNNLIRLVSEQGMESGQIVLLRNVVSVVIFLPWLMQKGSEVLSTQRLKAHFLRSALGIVSMEMWFYALAHMNLSEATALSFTTPIFVTIIAIFVLKEKSSLARLVAIGAGFAGVLVVMQPAAAGFDHLALLVLASAAIMATVSVLVKTLTLTEGSGVIVFYQALFMTPLSLPLALPVWRTPSLYEMGVILGVAVFSTLAHLLLTKAYRHAEMIVIMPIDFTRLIFTSVFAYALFGEVLSGATIAGAALIVAGAVISATINARQAAKIQLAESTDMKE